jgi:hypothetical protein
VVLSASILLVLVRSDTVHPAGVKVWAWSGYIQSGYKRSASSKVPPPPASSQSYHDISILARRSLTYSGSTRKRYPPPSPPGRKIQRQRPILTPPQQPQHFLPSYLFLPHTTRNETRITPFPRPYPHPHPQTLYAHYHPYPPRAAQTDTQQLARHPHAQPHIRTRLQQHADDTLTPSPYSTYKRRDAILISRIRIRAMRDKQ